LLLLPLALAALVEVEGAAGTADDDVDAADDDAAAFF
jgi:hypothetical protein